MDAVQRERDGCLDTFRAVRERIGELAAKAEKDGSPGVDPDDLRLELRRFDEAIESVRLGLHTTRDAE